MSALSFHPAFPCLEVRTFSYYDTGARAKAVSHHLVTPGDVGTAPSPKASQA